MLYKYKEVHDKPKKIKYVIRAKNGKKHAIPYKERKRTKYAILTRVHMITCKKNCLRVSLRFVDEDRPVYFTKKYVLDNLNVMAFSCGVPTAELEQLLEVSKWRV